MSYLRAIVRSGLICVAALMTACASNTASTPLWNSSRNPETLVCAAGQIQYCERLSGSVWGKCDCVTAWR